MSSGRPPLGSIPTLTEVVTWPAAAPTAAAVPPAPVLASVPPPASTPSLTPSLTPASTPAPAAVPIPPQPAAPIATEAELMQRVMLDLQKQVDLMLEVRLREALAPALVRATDTLAREARKELTSALKDIVAQAIARELGRRGPG